MRCVVSAARDPGRRLSRGRSEPPGADRARSGTDPGAAGRLDRRWGRDRGPRGRTYHYTDVPSERNAHPRRGASPGRLDSPRLDVDRVAAILADSLRTPGGRGGRPPVAPGPTLSCNSSRASPTVKLGRSVSNPTPTGRHAASGDSAPRVLRCRPNQQYVAASPIFAVPGQSRDRDGPNGANESSLAAESSRTERKRRAGRSRRTAGVLAAPLSIGHRHQLAPPRNS